MKAPHGTGMVVATADIQNCDEKRKDEKCVCWTVLKYHTFARYTSKSTYLHEDEEDERDEDVDLGVFPGVVVADVVKLLGHALTAPCTVVKQRYQRLVLCQLRGRHKEKLSACSHLNTRWTELLQTVAQSQQERLWCEIQMQITAAKNNNAFDTTGWNVLLFVF